MEASAARSALFAEQLQKRRLVLNEVERSEGFYAAKYLAAGVTSLGEFDNLPFTTKAVVVPDVW